jgi:hypothetical protein
MTAYELIIWAPTGQRIATVLARTPMAAVRKTPKPYQHLGEIYAREQGQLARRESC